MPPTEPTSRWTLLAVGLYGLQAALDVHWGPLTQLQLDPLYRKLSGGLLASAVLGQLWLAWSRRKAPAERSRVLLARHRWLGVTCLPMLFLHTTQLGFGYLLVLGLLIPLQVSVGALWPAGHGAPAQRLRPHWRLLHATLGLTLLTGMLLHIWMVFGWN